jgi:hypothetical protein
MGNDKQKSLEVMQIVYRHRALCRNAGGLACSELLTCASSADRYSVGFAAKMAVLRHLCHTLAV